MFRVLDLFVIRKVIKLHSHFFFIKEVSFISYIFYLQIFETILLSVLEYQGENFTSFSLDRLPGYTVRTLQWSVVQTNCTATIKVASLFFDTFVCLLYFFFVSLSFRFVAFFLEFYAG